MKRICALIAVLWVMFVFCPSPGSAQSDKDGIRIFNEAKRLMIKAKTGSKEDQEKALEFYQKALDIYRKTGNLQMQGMTLSTMGRFCGWLSQYKKALELSRQALDIHRKTGNLQMQGMTLTIMAFVYSRLGQYQEALEYGEKALVIQKRIGDVAEAAFSFNAMGLSYLSRGQYKEALEHFEKFLDNRKKMRGEEGTPLNNIALVYQSLGQYQKALEYFERALEKQTKRGDHKEETTTLTNIGGIYNSKGQYQKSLEYCRKALELAIKTGNPQGEAWSWRLMGSIYHAWGQRQKALEHYEKACEITRTIGDQHGEANSYSNIGQVCFGFAEYDDALKNYQRALEIKTRIGAPADSVKALMAWTYMEKGELDKAEDILKGTKSKWASGKLHLLKAEYDKAKTDYEKILFSAQKSGDVGGLLTAYTGLGIVYEGLEDYKKAEEYYEKGMTLTEEIRSGLLPSERKNFFEVKINGFQRSEPAKGLTRVRMKLNQAAGSIDSSEVTRARAFSDNIALTTKAGTSGVPNQVLQQENEIVSKVAALKKQLGKTDKEKSPATYANIDQQVQDAEAEMNTFVQVLWDKYKPYASVKYPKPVTLKESALKPEECVVIFDVSGEGVGVKLIKGKEIAETSYKKWKSEDLEKDVRKFRQTFEEVNLKEFDSELGQILYKKLLGAVLMQVPEGTPLVLIPDGILAILPFEALVVSGKPTWKEEGDRPYPEGLTYLGDVYPISYYESITAISLARTLRSKDKPGAKTLVIADPVFESDDARLKTASGKEQQKLLAALPEKLMSIKDQTGITFPRLSKTTELAESLKKLNPNKTDLFTGMQAKKSILFDKPLTDYGSIVFATHGYFGTDIPGIQEPVLAMTLVGQPKDQDGFVRMTEVMGMKLNADVVALTACQTGLGNNLAGEGVMSMGKAFQYAGAKSILMSLWSVSESGSVSLVEKFFEHLKSGKNKLEALKLAREDIRKEGYNHPFYWASFILVGEVN